MTTQSAVFRTLLREVNQLRREVSDQGRASQGAFRSVELTDAGRPTYYDATGAVSQIVYTPGGVTLQPVSTTPPAAPTAPDAVGVQGGIKVVWDGTFVNANWTLNVAHAEIHRGPVDGFEPEDATQIGAFTSFYGGEYFWASQPEEGEQWFCLVTVDRAGRRSAPSGYSSATALRIQPTTDGDSPATSPDVLLRGGIGALFGSWTAINNEDAVTYEVHLFEDDDTTVPVAGDPATLVAETASTLITIKQKANGDPLLYTSVYTMWVIAKDADGAAAPGAASSATMMLVTGADIAADYVYANDILANQITGGVMNATVLLAGLFQTATSGGRTEVGPFGIRIYDANGIDINVDLNGVLNRFRGSIDATDIIIRDALQMFGKLNKMGPGAVLTLTSTTSAPAQAPTLTWEYEEHARPGGGAYLTSAWWSADESQSAATEVYAKAGWIQRNGVPWMIPTVDVAPGDSWSERMPWSACRIAETAGNGWMATYHEKRVAGSTSWPKVMVGVWDDSAVPGGGAAVLLGELEIEPFSFSRRTLIAPRMYGIGGRNTFAAVTWDSTAKTIEWRDYVYSAAGGLVLSGYSGAGAFSVAGWAADEEFVGVEFGNSVALQQPDGGTVRTTLILHTNKNNYVYFFIGGVYVLQVNLNWPVTYSEQRQIFRSYDPYANEITSMFSANWEAGAGQKIYKYADNVSAGADTWWASYAWRGEATKPYRTEDSARTSIAYRRRARLRISVPALPAPVAGVGAARDPLKDPYGWVYFLGHGGVEPADAAMYEQPTQPTMVAGVVLADSSIALGAYPTWAGTHPVAVSTFPASSPAQIRSDGNDGGGNPLLSIDGAGHIRGQDITVPTDIRTGLAGKAFEQLSYVVRAKQVMVCTGQRSVGFTNGKVIWTGTFKVVGAGNNANTAASGFFDITFPAAGTSIPVHNSSVRTSLVSAGDGIPLGVEEALWYELPLGAVSTSQPGRFHVVGYNSNSDGFIPPAGWVLVCARFTGAPYFMWGDGERDSGYIYPTFVSGGGWSQYSVGTFDALFRLRNGRVKCRGLIAKGGAPFNTNMFQLPVNFRPVLTDIYLCPTAAAGSPALVYVATDGMVHAEIGGSGTWTGLSGIEFDADQ